MKKTCKKIFIFCCLALCFILCLTSCHRPTDDSDGDEKQRIGVGEVIERAAEAASPDAVLVSSDEGVLKIISQECSSVTDGLIIYTVEGIKEGSATVSAVDASSNTATQICTFTVQYEQTVHIGDGDLTDSIELDKTSAEVYRDDTLITYTVTTSPKVDKLELTQVSHAYQVYFFDELIEDAARDDILMVYELNRLVVDEAALTDELIEDEAAGTRYSASRVIGSDGKATWTVRWDMGDTAVRFVRINAFDTGANAVQTNYVKLNITYPVITSEGGFAELVKLFIKYNLTTPLMFKTDTRATPDYTAEIAAFRNLGASFSERFCNTALYGGASVSSISRYPTIAAYSITNFVDRATGEKINNDFFGGRVLLCDSKLHGFVHGLYEPISDELRAVIAYQNGWDIDEKLFPYAHSILERASAVLDEIITDGMTDFEKEKAIYTWMYEQGVNASINGWTSIPEGVEEYKAIKTAYGLLNNYGGDCMGWSGTFYTLCNMAGLDCVTVDVKTTAGGAAEDFFADHRINMIRLDGEYYFVEAFWSWQKADPSDGAYRYMNMTTEKAAMLYTWATEANGGPLVCDYESYLVDEQTGELLNK